MAEEVKEKELPSQPLTKREKRHIRHMKQLKVIWITGHVLFIVLTILELGAYILRRKDTTWGIRFYRLAFLSAAISYHASVAKTINGQIPNIYVLLSLDNFQYGVIALFWLFYPRRIIKVVPFLVYSILQTADYVARNILGGEKGEELSQTINEHSQSLKSTAAIFNGAILISLIFDLLLFRSGSFLSLCMFAFMLRLQFAYSSTTGPALEKALHTVDEHIESNKSIPASVKKAWGHVKRAIESSKPTSLVRQKGPPPQPKPKKKVYGGKESNLWLD